MSIEEKLERALKLLDDVYCDIDSMRHHAEMFGGFSVWEIDGDEALIEWPNLSIVGDKIQEFLEDEA